MKPIDYYEYWNKNRIDAHRKRLLHREALSLRIIDRISKPKQTFLDAGCGNGMFLQRVAERFPQLKLKGVDYSIHEVKEARKQGFDVKQADFGEVIPMKSNSVDWVYAGEVIEHLYDPDKLVTETHRMLRKGGYFLLSTPNLCAWFNRLIMPFGMQPLFLEPSTKSKLVGSGFLGRFKDGSMPVGHVRIFTLRALQDMLEMYGFNVIKVQGANYDEGFPSLALFADTFFTLFPSFSAHFVVLAQKR